jgi:hypothetical protein
MHGMIRAAVLVCLAALVVPTFGQQRVDPRTMYERLFAVVPLVGKGSLDDPKRPTYAPAAAALDPTSRSGILGYTHVVSDDGNFALVEFVAKDRSAFQAILADPSVKSFLKGRDKPEDIAAEFKKHKKDFDFTNFGEVIVP